MNEFEILEKEELAPQIKRFTVSAPSIARKAKVGQFIILRVDEKGERFPLTLVDWNPKEGTIIIVFQEVGVSTKKFGNLRVGDCILDIVGPLGNPAEIKNYGEAVVVGGGVGIASAYPRVKALKEAGNRVVSIIGAKTSNLLILEKEIEAVSDEVYVSTDDGSKGFKGFTSQVLKSLLDQGRKFDFVFAVGPAVMMRAVAEVTRSYGIKTVASLNPIMVDGTGMCGACRVTVGGETKFTCVDGPEFDAHMVDFAELIARQQTYLEEEQRAVHVHEGKVCSAADA
jgi:ferredoxin--NADP+ reductase